MAKQPSAGRAARRADGDTQDTVKADLDKPAQFDVNAFIAGAVVPNDTCRVTNNPAVVTRLSQLDKEATSIRKTLEAAEVTGDQPSSTRRRLAQKPQGEARLADIQAEVDQILGDDTIQWLEVRFRALDPFEKQAIAQRRSKTNMDVALDHFEVCGSLRPAGSEAEWLGMDRAGWAGLAEVIGVSQFEVLDRTCGSVAYGDTVGPDFWRRSSQSPTTDGS